MLRQFILTIFSLVCLYSFGQSEYVGNISSKFYKSGSFYLANENNDTISFKSADKYKYISLQNNKYKLFKRKYLLNEKEDTLAFYKRKHIYIPREDIRVKEIYNRNKYKWFYTLNTDTILTVRFILHEDFKVSANSNNWNDISYSCLQICLGKFNKRVLMDYENEDDDDQIITTVIISMLIYFML